MMDKSMNEYIDIYKKQLEQGDIRIAYEYLRKYMMVLKTYLTNHFADKYSFGNVYAGYMDYTYFYFFSDYLHNKKLRFGVALNHREMQFELWFMGQNAELQAEYWELLKNTEWSKGQTAMPQYSVLEVVLVDNPDFDNQDILTDEIAKSTICVADEIQSYIQSIK